MVKMRVNYLVPADKYLSDFFDKDAQPMTKVKTCSIYYRRLNFQSSHTGFQHEETFLPLPSKHRQYKLKYIRLLISKDCEPGLILSPVCSRSF